MSEVALIGKSQPRYILMAQRLQMLPGNPALRVYRWYAGDDGRAFECTISVNPQNRYSFSMSLTRDMAG